MSNGLKVIKKALAAKYGYKNVSVKGGTGTATGWIKVYIFVDVLTTNMHKEAEEIIKSTGVEIGTYTNDMNEDRSELLIQIRQK